MLSIDKCSTCMHYIQFRNAKLTAGGMCTVEGKDNVAEWTPEPPEHTCHRHMTKNVDNILKDSKTEQSNFPISIPNMPPPPQPQAQIGEFIDILPVPPGELVWIGKQIFVTRGKDGKEQAFDRAKCRIQHAEMS